MSHFGLVTVAAAAFLLAGCIYVGGAVGVELIGAPMEEDAMPYNLTTVVEEGMELAGVILFLAATLRHMAPRQDGSQEIEVTAGVHE